MVNILRNLSFDAPNARALAESGVALRLSLLCCHNQLPQLRRDGIDLLINLCSKVCSRCLNQVTITPSTSVRHVTDVTGLFDLVYDADGGGVHGTFNTRLYHYLDSIR